MAKQLTEEEAALKKRFEDLLLAVGETPEPPLPLACVLAVVELFPNAVYGGADCEMAVLVDDNGAKHHVSVKAGQFHEGEFAVLIGMNACAKSTPVFEKWRGSASRTVNFSFGGGKVAFDAITFRPERGAYRYNPGVLIPLSEFPELADCAVGDDVAERIGVMMHNEVVKRTIEKKEADEKAEKLLRQADEPKARYYQARDWRAHCPMRFCGPAPVFVRRTKLEKLEEHPEYFTDYADLLFDVTEKYNGINLSVYYDAQGDGDVHLYLDGREIADDANNYFWSVIRRQGIDRGLIDMGYAVTLEGVVTGPSVRGGLFEGRTKERFCVFDIYDNEDERTLDPSERMTFCRKAKIPHVKHVAFDFPLFEKAPTLLPLLRTAARPNAVGGIRYGLVFRAFDGENEIWFELANPDYKPNPGQLEVDAKFDARETRQGERT